MSDPCQRLALLHNALTAVQQGQLRSIDFCRQARDQPALLPLLPAHYGEVWYSLLDRLESSALFDEESCSFSQHDLLDSLHLWLDKAAERLRS